MGIIAPEIVVHTAVHQFYTALQLQKCLNTTVEKRNQVCAFLGLFFKTFED